MMHVHFRQTAWVNGIKASNVLCEALRECVTRAVDCGRMQGTWREGMPESLDYIRLPVFEKVDTATLPSTYVCLERSFAAQKWDAWIETVYVDEIAPETIWWTVVTVVYLAAFLCFKLWTDIVQPKKMFTTTYSSKKEMGTAQEKAPLT